MMHRRRVLIGVKSRLPSEYQEVEYIASTTGTNWIDTMIKPTVDTDISMTFSILPEDTGYVNVLGGSSNAQNGAPSVIFGATHGYLWMRCSSTAARDMVIDQKFDHDTKYEYALINKDAYLDGVKVSRFNADLSTPLNYTFTLFRRHQNPGFYPGASSKRMRLYDFWMRENGEYIMHLIPAIRIRDNKVGMYDIAGTICPLTGTSFYINAGTDYDFTAGNQI